MNTFKLVNTLVLKSELDFRQMDEQQNFSQEVSINGSIATLESAERSTIILSEAELNTGGPDDAFFIYLQIRCIFGIEEVTDDKTLLGDAAAFCRPIVMKELNNRLAALTKLHIGKALRIPGI